MAKPLNELRKKIKPKVKAAAKAKAAGILAEMSLAELRKSRNQSQVAVAEKLGLAQPNVSQIESRPDALVSTLSQYVKALDGKLEIRAVFADGEAVEIKQFNY